MASWSRLRGLQLVASATAAMKRARYSGSYIHCTWRHGFELMLPDGAFLAANIGIRRRTAVRIPRSPRAREQRQRSASSHRIVRRRRSQLAVSALAPCLRVSVSLSQDCVHRAHLSARHVRVCERLTMATDTNGDGLLATWHEHVYGKTPHQPTPHFIADILGLDRAPPRPPPPDDKPRPPKHKELASLLGELPLPKIGVEVAFCHYATATALLSSRLNCQQRAHAASAVVG